MVTRRHLFASALGAVIAASSMRASVAKARLGEDGLYQFDWYVESFLDLADDLAAATRDGKRFAILWGLRNCPACRRMHEVYMADPKVESYIRDHFAILHLNILGSRKVTDFGGSLFTEKRLAAHYGIIGTPAIQFFPRQADGLATRQPREREVARMEALPAQDGFLPMFQQVVG